jgi:hypothetical protein
MTTPAGPEPAAVPAWPGEPGIRHLAASRRAGQRALCAALIAAPLLAGCGSASAHSSPAAAATAATGPACAQVADALADGPDPDTDPVGFAEAQIRPLREIPTSDQALRAAISQLATAYAQVFASNGTSPAATSAVSAASKKLDAICPGATS